MTRKVHVVDKEIFLEHGYGSIEDLVEDIETDLEDSVVNTSQISVHPDTLIKAVQKLKGYMKLVYQVSKVDTLRSAKKRGARGPEQRRLSTSDEFNIPDAPLQSIEARYQDLLSHLGVQGHEGAIAEIKALREKSLEDKSETSITEVEKNVTRTVMLNKTVRIHKEHKPGDIRMFAFNLGCRSSKALLDNERERASALLYGYAFLLSQIYADTTVSEKEDSDKESTKGLLASGEEILEALAFARTLHTSKLFDEQATEKVGTIIKCMIESLDYRSRGESPVSEPKTLPLAQTKDSVNKTEHVGVYVARLEGSLNRAAFSHNPAVHLNVESAQQEALRLAKKEPGFKFGVFTCMGFYQLPPVEPEWTLSHCKKPD